MRHDIKINGGFKTVVCGSSKVADVIGDFGDAYQVSLHRWIDNHLIGFTLWYESVGLKFSFRLAYHARSWNLREYDHKRARLARVGYCYPWKKQTERGIRVRVNTLADVVKAYGQPEMREGVSVVHSDQPGASNLSKHVYACYPEIEFHVDRIRGKPIGDVDAYLAQRVVEIWAGP
jgi:hypothetical protein